MKISASSMMPFAISVISRSRCMMAASLLVNVADACSADCENDTSADGSVSVFQGAGDPPRSNGVVIPEIPRSSTKISVRPYTPGKPTTHS